ncbi:hypothetical protein AX14_002472, partial [Amanita brunnescens Koide BX004]
MSTPFCAKSDGVTLTYFLLLAVQDAELQIWKEVGSRLYYSRLMPTAPIISPEEAAEKKVPIKITNVENPRTHVGCPIIGTDIAGQSEAPLQQIEKGQQDVQGHTASLPDSQDVTTEPEVLPAPPHTNNQTLVTTIMFTFGIPAYHASLATIARDTMFDLKALVPVWKAVRHFDCVLLAALVTALFKESAQINPVYWFFITSSLLQASMGLICSTIFIIVSLGSRNEYTYNSAHEDKLRLMCWSVWDHFSLPAISTVWSILTFMTALIVDN